MTKETKSSNASFFVKNSNSQSIHIRILGNPGVGKSMLIQTISGGVCITSSIAFNVEKKHTKNILIEGKEIALAIYDDMAYDEDGYFINNKSYYTEIDAIMLCYDTTDENSFLNLSWFLNEIKCHNPGFTNIIIVGCKADRKDAKAVIDEEAQRFADHEGLQLICCSAQTGENVEHVFRLIAGQVLKKDLATQDTATTPPTAPTDSCLSSCNLL